MAMTFFQVDICKISQSHPKKTKALQTGGLLQNTNSKKSV